MDEVRNLQEFQTLCDSTKERWSSFSYSRVTAKPGFLLALYGEVDFVKQAQKKDRDYLKMGAAGLGSLAVPLALVGFPASLAILPVAAGVAALTKKIISQEKSHAKVEAEFPLMAKELREILQQAKQLQQSFDQSPNRSTDINNVNSVLRKFLDEAMGIDAKAIRNGSFLDRPTGYEDRSLMIDAIATVKVLEDASRRPRVLPDVKGSELGNPLRGLDRPIAPREIGD